MLSKEWQLVDISAVQTLSTSRVNYAGYVLVRQGSYGSQDPDRKGGSDEWLAPRKQSWWVVEYGGLYFFLMSVALACVMYIIPWRNVHLRQLGSRVIFFFDFSPRGKISLIKFDSDKQTFWRASLTKIHLSCRLRTQ